MTLLEFKTVFDSELTEEVQKRIRVFESYTTDETVRMLVRHVETLLQAGGKRIRPYLCVTSYLAFGGKEEHLACMRRRAMALELFHLFALIHDDIIDRGATRHGVPTIHAYAKQLLTASGRHGDIEHIAESHALMVGDLVFSWAHALWFEGYAEPALGDAFVRATTYFSEMSTEVIVGEMLDVDITTRVSASYELILQKTLLKTATYTFTRPMHIGLAFATWSKEAETFCTEFGTALGVGFQLQDDLLDIIGDETKTAKPTMQDIAEGQHTVCTDFVFSHGTEEAQSLLRSALGHSVSQETKSALVQMFTDTGATASVEQDIRERFIAARAILHKQTMISDQAKEELFELIHRIEHRTS